MTNNKHTVAYDAGNKHIYVINPKGELYVKGYLPSNNTPTSDFTKATDFSNVKQVIACGAHVCILLENGDLMSYCSDSNSYNVSNGKGVSWTNKNLTTDLTDVDEIHWVYCSIGGIYGVMIINKDGTSQYRGGVNNDTYSPWGKLTAGSYALNAKVNYKIDKMWLSYTNFMIFLSSGKLYGGGTFLKNNSTSYSNTNVAQIYTLESENIVDFAASSMESSKFGIFYVTESGKLYKYGIGVGGTVISDGYTVVDSNITSRTLIDENVIQIEGYSGGGISHYRSYVYLKENGDVYRIGDCFTSKTWGTDHYPYPNIYKIEGLSNIKYFERSTLSNGFIFVTKDNEIIGV